MARRRKGPSPEQQKMNAVILIIFAVVIGVMWIAGVFDGAGRGGTSVRGYTRGDGTHVSGYTRH